MYLREGSSPFFRIKSSCVRSYPCIWAFFIDYEDLDATIELSENVLKKSRANSETVVPYNHDNVIFIKDGSNNEKFYDSYRIHKFHRSKSL